VREILPGVHHWTAFHEGIKMDVSSYYVEPAGALIDPMVPAEGVEVLREHQTAPQQILLTNRHHLRHGERFAEAFGIPIRASRPGMHEFERGPDVEPFEFGDEIAPGITAVEIGGICPDDTALHIALGAGAIAFADALVHVPDWGGLTFVPDNLMDDPERDKAAMLGSFRGLLDRDFDSLLFAHGEPLARGGKSALRDFVRP
jgi:hypothetical protein